MSIFLTMYWRNNKATDIENKIFVENNVHIYVNM